LLGLDGLSIIGYRCFVGLGLRQKLKDWSSSDDPSKLAKDPMKAEVLGFG
jgi:hypothetical protein